jgi:hypothetical protein
VRELVSAEVSPTTDTTTEKKAKGTVEVKRAFVSEGGVRGSNLETSPVRSGDRLGLGLLLLGLSCSSWRLCVRRKCGWGQRRVSPAWHKVDVTKKNQYAIEIPRPVCVGGGSALVDVCRRKRQLPQKRSVLAHVNEVQGPRAEARSCGEGGVEGGSDEKGREGQASGE